MNAFRAEIWCDGENCVAGQNQGISHDDPTQLIGLTRNLSEELRRRGWTFAGSLNEKAYCPRCTRKGVREKS